MRTLSTNLGSLAAAAMTSLLALTGVASAQNYASVNGVDLFYQDVGDGDAIIFAPGWTFSSEIFTAQIEHFSDDHRVIAYDPRSHGRSGVTLDGNTYSQHGADLAAFVEELGLDSFVFVGWSAGCFDGYDYVRRAGTESLSGFVCIDQPPKTFADAENAWAIGDWAGWKGFIDGTAAGHLGIAQWFSQWMVIRELSEDEVNALASQSMQTPTHAAVNLLASSAFSDYRAEAILISEAIPYMNIVREDWSETAQAWIDDNTPGSQVFVLGAHAMFWEFPDEVNAQLGDFLADITP